MTLQTFSQGTECLSSHNVTLLVKEKRKEKKDEEMCATTAELTRASCLDRQSVCGVSSKKAGRSCKACVSAAPLDHVQFPRAHASADLL